MKKYSTEYWLAHYEFAMGHKSKINIDTSNVDWTKNNIEKVLRNEIPYGMTGTNGAIVLVEYLKEYNPDKVQKVAKLMLGYIKSIQSKDKPLKKVYDYYESVITA